MYLLKPSLLVSNLMMKWDFVSLLRLVSLKLPHQMHTLRYRCDHNCKYNLIYIYNYMYMSIYMYI